MICDMRWVMYGVPGLVFCTLRIARPHTLNSTLIYWIIRGRSYMMSSTEGGGAQPAVGVIGNIVGKQRKA